MEWINIAIVDDQNLFRQSLALLIESVGGIKLVLEADGGDAFLSKLRLAKDLKIDIAIIDMDMPGMNGIELNSILHEKYPDIKVIILSVHIQPLLIAQMINAGAVAYLAKNCDKDELLMAIETVYKTGYYFNSSVLKAIQHSANHKMHIQKTIDNTPVQLTAREKQVLQWIGKELSNAEIATKLYLSVRTVEGHRNNLLAKTGCKNTAGLVLFAIKYDIIQLPL